MMARVSEGFKGLSIDKLGNVHDESAKKTKDARHCTARSRAAEAATIVVSSLFYERYVY